MTAPLSTQKKAALWRAYKQRPTAEYVAKKCGVSWHTAQKYIKELKFAERWQKIEQEANKLVDKDQAESLAEEIQNISHIKSIALDMLETVLSSKELIPSISDYIKLVQLERALRGEHDNREEEDSSIRFEWLPDELAERPCSETKEAAEA
jgi:predicted transcriptional regulator